MLSLPAALSTFVHVVLTYALPCLLACMCCAVQAEDDGHELVLWVTFI